MNKPGGGGKVKLGGGGGGGGGGGVQGVPTFSTGWLFYYGVSTRHSRPRHLPLVSKLRVRGSAVIGVWGRAPEAFTLYASNPAKN